MDSALRFWAKLPISGMGILWAHEFVGKIRSYLLGDEMTSGQMHIKEAGT